MRKGQNSNPRANRRLFRVEGMWVSYFPTCLKTDFSSYKSKNKKRDLATELHLPTKASCVLMDVAHCKWCQFRTVRGALRDQPVCSSEWKSFSIAGRSREVCAWVLCLKYSSAYIEFYLMGLWLVRSIVTTWNFFRSSTPVLLLITTCHVITFPFGRCA